jgi:hypothetical protein
MNAKIEEVNDGNFKVAVLESMGSAWGNPNKHLDAQ